MTVNEVPLRPGRVELDTSICPPMSSTMPRVTHSPTPVPFSPLVVKKGAKTFSRC